MSHPRFLVDTTPAARLAPLVDVGEWDYVPPPFEIPTDRLVWAWRMDAPSPAREEFAPELILDYAIDRYEAGHPEQIERMREERRAAVERARAYEEYERRRRAAGFVWVGR